VFHTRNFPGSEGQSSFSSLPPTSTSHTPFFILRLIYPSCHFFKCYVFSKKPGNVVARFSCCFLAPFTPRATAPPIFSARPARPSLSPREVHLIFFEQENRRPRYYECPVTGGSGYGWTRLVVKSRLKPRKRECKRRGDMEVHQR